MKRAALYVRVSTAEQKKYGMSVDSQIDALQKYCQENGYIAVDVYNDAGHTARKSYRKRSELIRLTNDCKAHKIDIILFTKLDRWFRSVADYYEIQKILDDNDVKWKTIWEDYETETSAGVFKVNIMLAVAQAEADRTSERIKAVNEYRRTVKNEYPGGKAPTGYMVRKSQLLIDPEKREGVAAFFKDYLTYFNMAQAVRVLHSYGINVRRDTARRMLNNTAYYGAAHGTTCEPYITKEDFDKIQSVCNGIKQRRVLTPGRVYLFTGGILRCAHCGSSAIGTVRTMPSGKNVKKYNYYLCNKARNMACDNTRRVTEMVIERKLIEQIEAELDAYNLEADICDAGVVDNTEKIASLNSRLERLADLYEFGDIDRSAYLAKKKAILDEIETLSAPPEIHEKKALPPNWKELYSSLSQDDKKAFWFNIARRIEFDPDANIKIIF